MKKIVKPGLLLFAILYFVLPDLIPGPIDDIIVVVLALIASTNNKRIGGPKN